VVDADFYDPENEVVEPLSDSEKKGDDEEKKVLNLVKRQRRLVTYKFDEIVPFE
jgi:hypothetical protein